MNSLLPICVFVGTAVGFGVSSHLQGEDLADAVYAIRADFHRLEARVWVLDNLGGHDSVERQRFFIQNYLTNTMRTSSQFVWSTEKEQRAFIQNYLTNTMRTSLQFVWSTEKLKEYVALRVKSLAPATSASDKRMSIGYKKLLRQFPSDKKIANDKKAHRRVWDRMYGVGDPPVADLAPRKLKTAADQKESGLFSTLKYTQQMEDGARRQRDNLRESQRRILMTPIRLSAMRSVENRLRLAESATRRARRAYEDYVNSRRSSRGR